MMGWDSALWDLAIAQGHFRPTLPVAYSKTGPNPANKSLLPRKGPGLTAALRGKGFVGQREGWLAFTEFE